MKEASPAVSRPIIFFVVFAGILLAVGIACIYSKVQKPVYASSSVIYLEGVSSDKGEKDPDPDFLKKEFEIIRSKEILLPILHDLEFKKKKAFSLSGFKELDEEGRYNQFTRHHLQVRSLKNRKLVEITVFWGDTNTSTRLANAIAHAYIDAKFSAGGIPDTASQKRLAQDIAKQNGELQKTQKKVDDLLKKPKSKKNTRALADTNKELAQQQALVKSLEDNKDELGTFRKSYQIVTEAISEDHPFRPDMKLNMIRGAAVGFVLALLFSCFLIKKPALVHRFV